MTMELLVARTKSADIRAHVKGIRLAIGSRATFRLHLLGEHRREGHSGSH